MRILYHHRIASKDGQAVHVGEIIHVLRGQNHEVVIGPQVSPATATVGATAHAGPRQR
jgi:hypothetical protein